MRPGDSSGRDFVYLASMSPRRRELLAQLGLRCEVVPANVDESRHVDESAADYVTRLALAKGRAMLAQLGAVNAPIVSADTTVVVGTEILGKPADGAECRQMLGRLSGRVHHVYTAVAVMTTAHEEAALSRSTVRFRTLSDAEIDRYWSSGEPEDKAGAYAIQGLGAAFIEEITGSYSGVVGLPLCETARLLAGFGYCLP